MNPVPARSSTNINHRVANAFGPAMLQIFMTDHSDAHGIDQRISRVAGIETHFPGNGRNTDAIAIACNSSDHSAKQVTVSFDDGDVSSLSSL